MFFRGLLVLRTVSDVCTRFRAYHSRPRKNRRKRAGSLRTRRYTPCTDLAQPPDLSDILRGSYLLFGAISRIIADCALSDAPLSYYTRPCVSRGFSKFSGIFLRDRAGSFVRFAARTYVEHKSPLTAPPRSSVPPDPGHTGRSKIKNKK